MIRDIQEKMRLWRERNFQLTDRSAMCMTLGVAEESGELAHAVLKRHQRIRGFDKAGFFTTHARDAVGDIVIYLMGVCDAYGWDLQIIIEETARSVLKRDWKEDPDHGGEEDPFEDR